MLTYCSIVLGHQMNIFYGSIKLIKNLYFGLNPGKSKWSRRVTSELISTVYGFYILEFVFKKYFHLNFFYEYQNPVKPIGKNFQKFLMKFLVNVNSSFPRLPITIGLILERILWNFGKPGRTLGREVPWNKANKITLPNRTFRNKNRKRKNSISFETLKI